MNQSIIFVDRVEYDENTKRVFYFAQVSGQLVTCCYSTNKSKEGALLDFESKKFDYEDIAENAIEGELYNDEGLIEVEELL